MKVYEKHLMTEAISAAKYLEKIKHTLSSLNTTVELQLVKGMIVTFIKKFGSYYTDEVSKELDDLLSLASKRVKK